MTGPLSKGIDPPPAVEAERLRSFFDHLPVGAADLDAQGNYQLVNDRFCQLTGYDRHELLAGLSTRDLTHPDDLQAHESFLIRVQGGGEHVGEKRLMRKDGRMVWVRVSATALRDGRGQITRQLGIVEDITAHKLAEEALRYRDAQLAQVLEASGSGAWDYDPTTQRVWWSPETYDLFGVTRGTPMDLDEVQTRVHPDDRPAMTEKIARAIDGGTDFHHVFRIEHPVRGPRWLQATGRLMSVAGERPRRLMGITFDVTERRDSEDMLRVALRAAEQANRDKSRFLAAASHDLRQPLAALTIYAMTLAKHVSQVGQTTLSSLHDCVASLGVLLDDLLDLSKLEAGVMKVHPRSVDLAEMLAPLVAAHAPAAQAKGLRLRCRPTHRAMHTDPVLLGRVVGNLLANAVRYTDVGGVLVGCRRHDGKDWLEVWDTGIGIPEESLDEIFREFNQLGDGSHTHGSGLGLAIVARTARLLGLEIRVRSRPGSGSMFAVALPPVVTAVDVTVRPAGPATRRSMRIAVVEDNAQVRKAMAAGLEHAGHRVLAASGIDDLLTAGSAQRPDIVLSDYRLSRGETGYQAISRARQAWGDGLPALLISGDTDPVLLRSMAERGIVVIHKPVALNTLLDFIEHAVKASATAARAPQSAP